MSRSAIKGKVGRPLGTCYTIAKSHIYHLERYLFSKQPKPAKIRYCKREACKRALYRGINERPRRFKARMYCDLICWNLSRTD